MGCSREPEPQWESSELVTALPSDLQIEVRAQLRDSTGTWSNPRLLTDDTVSESTLKRGQAVYQKRCVQCHGVNGDGAGAAAAFLYPRPRDYRKGIFKFTSTPFGSRPLKEDLIRTVKRGISGTSMPPFKLLAERDIAAVVEYVLVLTQRGELEEQLATLAEQEEELDPELVAEEIVPLVISRWREARAARIDPLTPPPLFAASHVEAGREAFLSRGCSKCHGEDGRGLTADNLKASLKDVWGHPTRAADLTSGMLRGGQEPLDIYRRIYGGINGTPMPGFASALREEPETIWNLVAYVLHVSSRRREGVSPHPGPMTPYIPPAASESGG